MTWKPLQLSPAAGTHLPALLISTSFASSSYEIHLTDLTHIWSESLSKQDIIRRSRAENTSIDPSNGDQFKIFVQKLKLGLQGGKDSALSLTINSDSDRPSLVLHVSVDLPGGLLPLEWPIHLSLGSQQLLSSQLIVPLLRAQHERLQELSGLAEVLKEKDHVIQKLLDKLEDLGTDLGQLFPQVAGRPGRKVDRKKAEERVKGLGPFDMDSWKTGLRGHEVTQSITDLLGEVFQESDSHIEPEELDLDNWWDDLGGITVNLSTGKISTKGVSRDRRSPVKSAPPLLPVQDSIDANDDFQVQSTPPHLSKSRAVDADTTDDDDDLDAPSQRSKVPDSFPVSQSVAPPSPPPKVTKKLGIIGKKKKTPEPEPKPEPILDEETASESENENATSPPKNVPSPPKRTPTPPPPPKAKKGLGRIGGKKEPPPLPEPSLSPEPEVPATKTPPKPTKSKLGKIGGKKTAAVPKKEPSPAPILTTSTETPTTDQSPHLKRKIGTISHHEPSSTSSPRSPIAKKEEKTPAPEVEVDAPPEETTEEKANRKRQQLKRELEEKARAPVKKKRKF